MESCARRRFRAVQIHAATGTPVFMIDMRLRKNVHDDAADVR